MGYSFPSNMARNHFKLLLWIWIPSFAFMDLDQVIYHVFLCTKTSIDDVYKWVMYIHIQLIWISLGSASRLSLPMQCIFFFSKKWQLESHFQSTILYIGSHSIKFIIFNILKFVFFFYILITLHF